jgi:hypothetical protein
MQLLPQAIAASLPALYTTEETRVDEKVLLVKFFDPYTQWTWYACEYDPKERLFFGYVVGQEKEWGEFSLDELESLMMPDRVTSRIERDVNFAPTSFNNLNL